MPVAVELPLRGRGGEPISFARTVYSHGCAALPPARLQRDPLVYYRTLTAGRKHIEVALRDRRGKLSVETPDRAGVREVRSIERAIARMFRLSDDLSAFYARIAHDDSLAWATRGAGRILAAPSVLEDVVKTICTTNCAWSATERMTGALTRLGDGAFPSAQLLASTPEPWFRDVARMGYRGAYVRAIALAVASGSLDLEALTDRGLDDGDVERALLQLPGIGPYGAAHVMLLLGRNRPLVLDSWTRPKYRRLTGKRRAADSTIRRQFSRYGEYAGLAFWLFLTRDWIEEDPAEASTRLRDNLS
ncbi:MAG: Fe-S cluster assembly protein HesB [Candidatus Eremiobacteraeota bacterium]|nr:Fe-S cluster assembly protein HesB [Candidatus Eremiobacteraeota bacterium]